MGADLIIATLWATLGPEHEHVVQERPFTHRDPVIDWQAGHDYIDTLSWSREEMEKATNWANIYLKDLDAIDDPTDGDYLLIIRTQLHDKLTEVKASIEDGWRDVDGRVFGDCIMFLSGGLSWGDPPTEASELWWFWDEVDEFLPGVGSVLTKTGFWWMGSDDAPFEIVRKK